MSQQESLSRRWRRTRASFLNLFAGSDARRWDESFAEGHWAFLDSVVQRPRHYAIAGMLRAAGASATSVLDVGCGTGALVPHLPTNVTRYVGIDISAEAVGVCRNKNLLGTGRTFQATSFDDYVPQEPFQVIVFNEMLYYYPLRRIAEVVSRATTLLIEGSGTIIVSVHNRSLKRYHVWKRLAACMVPAESVEAKSLDAGLSWKVKRYVV